MTKKKPKPEDLQLGFPGEGFRALPPERAARAIRRHLATNGTGAQYIVATADGTPIDFDPYDPDHLSAKELSAELSDARELLANRELALAQWRKTNNDRQINLIYSGVIPLESIAGFVTGLEYATETEAGPQHWRLSLMNQGPLLTDDSPLTHVLQALTAHLPVPGNRGVDEGQSENEGIHDPAPPEDDESEDEYWPAGG